MEWIKATKQTHKQEVSMMLAAFPEYRGRIFRLEQADHVFVDGYWEGGSRTFTRFLSTETWDVITEKAIPQHLYQQAGNPYRQPLGRVPLMPGVAAVQHMIVCGKDRGLLLILPKMALSAGHEPAQLPA